MNISKAQLNGERCKPLKWKKPSVIQKLLQHRNKLLLLGILSPLADSSIRNLKYDILPQEQQVAKLDEYVEQVLCDKDFIRDTVSGTATLLVLLLLFDLSMLNKRRRATHELGHFLAHQLVKAESIPKYITIKMNDYESPTSCTTPHFSHRRLSNPTNSLRTLIQEQVMGKSGEVLEKLVYGYSFSFGLIGDKIHTLRYQFAGALFCAENKPEEKYYSKFASRLEKCTRELLEQIEPEVVNKLVDKLSEEKSWSEEELQQIIEEFGLNNFPAFEEVVEEIKMVLS